MQQILPILHYVGYCLFEIVRSLEFSVNTCPRGEFLVKLAGQAWFSVPTNIFLILRASYIFRGSSTVILKFHLQL